MQIYQGELYYKFRNLVGGFNPSEKYYCSQNIRGEKKIFETTT